MMELFCCLQAADGCLHYNHYNQINELQHIKASEIHLDG